MTKTYLNMDKSMQENTLFFNTYDREESEKRKIRRIHINNMSQHLIAASDKGEECVVFALEQFINGVINSCLIEEEENEKVFDDIIQYLSSSEFLTSEKSSIETTSSDNEPIKRSQRNSKKSISFN